MTYGLIMLIASAFYIANTIKQRHESLARAEAMRRHPAGKGR